MHYRLSALLAQTCRSVRVCAARIHAARRRRWDQPLGQPLESSRSTAETVNPSVTQRLPVTKQLVCYPHKQQLHNCPSTPNSAPTIRPVFPPGQRYVVCGLPLSLAGPHVLLALFPRAHSCLSCPCVSATMCAVHGRKGVGASPSRLVRPQCLLSHASCKSCPCMPCVSQDINPLLSRIPALT